MGHILDTGSRRVVAHKNVIAIIVIDSWVSIHDLSKDVSTDSGEISAEEHADISGEPSWAWHELMDMSQTIPLKQFGFIQQIHNMGFLVADIGDWSESKVFVQIVLDSRVPFAQSNVHLYGALTMPNINQFLFCDVIDIFEHCGQVEISHVLEGELPKRSILVRVILDVLAGVLITSTVAKPDIIAGIGQHESWSLFLIVDNPGI